MNPQLSQQQQNSLNFLNSSNQTPQQPQGNWFEKLLPTIGGIGGGILGSFVEPGLGSIAGASAGSALGQQLENTLTGTKGSTLGAAAEGGVGQLTGLGVGKAIGGAGKALTGMAAKTTEDVARAAQAQNLASEFGGALNAKAQNTLKLGNSVDLANKLNIPTSAEHFSNTSNLVNQFLTPLKTTVLAEAGPADMSSVPNIIKSAVESQGRLGSIPLGAKSAQTEAGNLYNEIMQPFRGSNAINGHPESVSSFINDLGAKLGDAKATVARQESISGVADPTDLARLKALSKAYGDVNEAVYGRPEVSNVIKNIKDMTPEEVAARVPGIDPNSPLAQHMADLVNSSQTYKDINTGHSQFVNMGKAGQIAGEYNKNVVATPSAVKQATAEMSTPGASGSSSTIGTLAALHPKTAILSKIAGVFNRPQVIAPAGGALSAIGGGATPTVLSQLAAHAPSIGAEPSPVSFNTAGNIMDTSTGANPDLLKLMIANSLTGGNLTSALAPMLQQQQQAQIAQPQLANLEQQYAAAGGGQGFGSGILSQISSLIPGTAAYQYNQEKQALASALAKATGTDAGSILKALPSIMATQEGAQGQFGALQGQLGAVNQPSALSSIFGQ